MPGLFRRITMITDILETTMIARCASLLTAEVDGEIVRVNVESMASTTASTTSAATSGNA